LTLHLQATSITFTRPNSQQRRHIAYTLYHKLKFDSNLLLAHRLSAVVHAPSNYHVTGEKKKI